MGVERQIPSDLKVDYATLCEPYVEPATLAWAIERDKNMQRFAKGLVERIADLAAEVAELERKGKDLCSAYGNSLITIHDLRKALHDVVNGNDLAHSRKQTLQSWPESHFRKQALEIIERTDQLQPKGEQG